MEVVFEVPDGLDMPCFVHYEVLFDLPVVGLYKMCCSLYSEAVFVGSAVEGRLVFVELGDGRMLVLLAGMYCCGLVEDWLAAVAALLLFVSMIIVSKP